MSDKQREDEMKIGTTDRCRICGWTLAASRKEGCVEGDCIYRPEVGSKEWLRCERNRIGTKMVLTDDDLAHLSSINRQLGVCP